MWLLHIFPSLNPRPLFIDFIWLCFSCTFFTQSARKQQLHHHCHCPEIKHMTLIWLSAYLCVYSTMMVPNSTLGLILSSSPKKWSNSCELLSLPQLKLHGHLKISKNWPLHCCSVSPPAPLHQDEQDFPPLTPAKTVVVTNFHHLFPPSGPQKHH